MRLMMVGDPHSKEDAWEYWLKQCLKHDVTHVWAVGDVFTDPTTFLSHLDRLSRMLERTGVEVYFSDGNHDPQPILRNFLTGEKEGVKLLRKNIQFVDRGVVVELDGIKFMSFGGAVSHDKERQLMREEETGIRTWYPEEAITRDEVRQAIAVAQEEGPIDVMVTHDYPHGVDFSRVMLKVDYPECVAQRKLIRQVVAVAQPVILYHGHHHLRYNDELTIDGNKVIIRGLSDGSKGIQSWLIFDTNEYRETIGLERQGVTA